MSVTRAIFQLEAELVELGLGSTRPPAEGTTDWYLMRAKAAGLSMLRRINQLELEPQAAERFYRKAIKAAKIEDAHE